MHQNFQALSHIRVSSVAPNFHAGCLSGARKCTGESKLLYKSITMKIGATLSSLSSSGKGFWIPVTKVKCLLKVMTAINPEDLYDLRNRNTVISSHH